MTQQGGKEEFDAECAEFGCHDDPTLAEDALVVAKANQTLASAVSYLDDAVAILNRSEVNPCLGRWAGPGTCISRQLTDRAWEWKAELMCDACASLVFSMRAAHCARLAALERRD